jgi:small subunit ribosomal protein S2
MAVVTIRQLLDSGVHFGHQTRRWNPKIKRFILTERSRSHIIDLQQSLAYIDKTYDYVRETVAHGGTILFVGTKKQAQGAIAEQAQRVGQPFVNQRWLGGLLTNFQTVSKRLARMKELEEIDFDDTTKGFTKKELLIKKRELTKLHKSLGGIRNLTRTPSALWVVDTKKEHLAIDEARKLGIPVIGILDTNCDPDEVQYPIPGNDDAIRSVALLTRIVADAAAEGLIQRHQKSEGDGEAAEPMAEWEAELLHSGTPEFDKAPSPAEDSAPDAATAVDGETPVTDKPAKAEKSAAFKAPKAEKPEADKAPKAEKAADEKSAKAEKPDAGKAAKADKPAAVKSAADKPAAGEPAADKPAKADKPAAKKADAKAPAAKKTPSKADAATETK